MQDGKVEKVNDEMFKPNGICFSPDYKKLYVCDTGASHYEKAPKNIMFRRRRWGEARKARSTSR